MGLYMSTAEIECLLGYVKASQGMQTITCLDNGAWSSEPIACTLECGEPKGMEKNNRNFPWHASIYRKDASGKHEHVC